MKKIIAVTAAAGLLAVGASGGAVAGALLTGADIKNGTIESQDIKNGNVTSRDVANATLKLRDLTPALRELVLERAAKGEKGDTGATGPRGPVGPAGQDAAAQGSVRTNFVAKDGATILSPTSVRLSNVGTPAGASVEILDLNLPAQATKTVKFTYRLEGGAVYAAGSPRVYLQIGETFYNTFDNAPEDAGVNNGDGTFTKSWTIPVNGTIHAAGVVVDNGVGTVTVSNLTIDGYVIKFSG
jgi:hypothetical protein